MLMDTRIIDDNNITMEYRPCIIRCTGNTSTFYYFNLTFKPHCLICWHVLRQTGYFDIRLNLIKQAIRTDLVQILNLNPIIFSAIFIHTT